MQRGRRQTIKQVKAVLGSSIGDAVGIPLHFGSIGQSQRRGHGLDSGRRGLTRRPLGLISVTARNSTQPEGCDPVRPVSPGALCLGVCAGGRTHGGSLLVGGWCCWTLELALCTCRLGARSGRRVAEQTRGLPAEMKRQRFEGKDDGVWSRVECCMQRTLMPAKLRPRRHHQLSQGR